MSAGTPNKPTTASPLTRTPLPNAVCPTTRAARPRGATSPPGTTHDTINMVPGPLPPACCTVNDVADATSPPGFARRPRHARALNDALAPHPTAAATPCHHPEPPRRRKCRRSTSLDPHEPRNRPPLTNTAAAAPNDAPAPFRCHVTDSPMPVPALLPSIATHNAPAITPRTGNPPKCPPSPPLAPTAATPWPISPKLPPDPH
ncbi:hypothetical protein HYPSUDRAFT_207954 [Hypholoma sublateritium FD-334 SS-4]|uniref:Uncharacterized protein n=1 Tax=Hypholoma sublateritium (strain FD-334 SS-4) TaxID=945553 RepID=A0A0D2NFA7_HYPSF|nr:hypothetical protein HYPSUDRAFT_207954 [Hypholoma sublateritium FD-334 SS-4]